MAPSETGSAPGETTRARAQAPSRRVGDAERDEVAQRLAEATADGLLQFDELDERLSRVFAARTGGELAVVTADLPAEWLWERQRTERAARGAVEARRGLAAQVRWYLLVMAGLVAVWAAVGVTAHAWYPWPVWPALGWGIGLVKHARAAYAGQTPRPRFVPAGWSGAPPRRTGTAPCRRAAPARFGPAATGT
jgi:hypothetical protein